MSYLALARKWRPRRFDDVLGQRHVVQALQHALDSDKLHPAILLTGTRGVGKTTLGRIIAKGLNCETGVSANPCGVCSACREVDEGRFVDLLEIDAASRTKVDDTRQLLDNVQYSPVRGRYKVYLIDEVHMLSNSSFNALLKTLEEPPPHVKFILATTDPQKLPVTVLSRCLQFSLKRLPVATIRENLSAVLEREGITAEAGVCTEIARAADGSMRDGLSLLDQAIAFAGGQGLKTESVEEMIGAVGRRTLLDLLQALAAQDAAGVLAAFTRLESQAPDYAALLTELAARLQRIAVLQLLPAAVDEDEEPVLRELAGSMAPEDVQLYYQIAVLGRRDLPWAPEPRLGFEMTLLRMLAFRPDGGGGAPASGGATRAAASAARGAAAPAASAAAAPTARAAVTPMAASRAAIAPAMPPPVAVTADPEPANDPQVALAATVVALRPAALPSGDWPERIPALGLDELSRQLARHCAWLGVEAGTAKLCVEYGVRHLVTEDRRQLLLQALSRQNAEIHAIAFDVAAPDGVIDSPIQRERDAAIKLQRDAEQAFAADPVVRELMRQFNATIRSGSVRPA